MTQTILYVQFLQLSFVVVILEKWPHKKKKKKERERRYLNLTLRVPWDTCSSHSVTSDLDHSSGLETHVHT